MTAGASGLGDCTAELFVKNGAKVLIADIQDENLMKNLVIFIFIFIF